MDDLPEDYGPPPWWMSGWAILIYGILVIIFLEVTGL